MARVAPALLFDSPATELGRSRTLSVAVVFFQDHRGARLSKRLSRHRNGEQQIGLFKRLRVRHDLRGQHQHPARAQFDTCPSVSARGRRREVRE